MATTKKADSKASTHSSIKKKHKNISTAANNVLFSKRFSMISSNLHCPFASWRQHQSFLLHFGRVISPSTSGATPTTHTLETQTPIPLQGGGHGRACNSHVCRKQTLEPDRVPLHEYRAEIAARVVLRWLSKYYPCCSRFVYVRKGTSRTVVPVIGCF